MQTDTSITMINTSLIIPNKYQPRKIFDEKALNTLAESIKTYGIINPILVRKKENQYEIIAGERRYRAAKQLGLTEIPVIIKSTDEQQTAELALIENLERHKEKNACYLQRNEDNDERFPFGKIRRTVECHL